MRRFGRLVRRRPRLCIYPKESVVQPEILQLVRVLVSSNQAQRFSQSSSRQPFSSSNSGVVLHPLHLCSIRPRRSLASGRRRRQPSPVASTHSISPSTSKSFFRSGGERQTPEWYEEKGIEMLYQDPVKIRYDLKRGKLQDRDPI
ncbi:hypothetical protein K1719_004362 [Acacia pycnantha]|nr:hypothetical protein K1719_004362 [Acacia pycnantha]